MRELTRRYDVLLVTDEIVTAFGRTGRMFACEAEDVVPDFLCLGKSITGGYLPLSATITHPDIYAGFLGTATSGRALMHGHTYAGNPLAAAAALAMLDILQQDQIHGEVARQVQPLGRRSWSALPKHPRVAETRQLGLIGAVELTPSGDPKERFPD